MTCDRLTHGLTLANNYTDDLVLTDYCNHVCTKPSKLITCKHFKQTNIY